MKKENTIDDVDCYTATPKDPFHYFRLKDPQLICKPESSSSLATLKSPCMIITENSSMANETVNDDFPVLAANAFEGRCQRQRSCKTSPVAALAKVSFVRLIDIHSFSASTGKSSEA